MTRQRYNSTSADKYVDYLKPKGFESYLTRAELADRVGRSRKRISQLEEKGTLPSPVRVKVGKHMVRLYSPEDVQRVVEHFARYDEQKRRWEQTRKKNGSRRTT